MAWRTGNKVGRTIYNELDELIGTMDTPELAKRVVKAVNEQYEDTYDSETGTMLKTLKE